MRRCEAVHTPVVRLGTGSNSFLFIIFGNVNGMKSETPDAHCDTREGYVVKMDSTGYRACSLPAWVCHINREYFPVHFLIDCHLLLLPQLPSTTLILLVCIVHKDFYMGTCLQMIFGGVARGATTSISLIDRSWAVAPNLIGLWTIPCAPKT